MARGVLLGRRVALGRQGYASASTDLFARFTTPPTDARKQIIDTCIKALIGTGLWSKLDCLYLAGADAQATQRNWKQDAFNLTTSGTVTFTADRGYAGNGTDGFLNTNFNPTATPGNYVQDSASAGVFNRTAAALSNTSMADLGVVSGGFVRVSPRVTGDLFVMRCNRAVNFSAASADGVGFFHTSRTAAPGYKGYKNGVEIGDAASAPSTGIPNDNITLLRDASLYSTHQLAAAFIGSGLTAQQGVDLYNAVLAYLQAVGAA